MIPFEAHLMNVMCESFLRMPGLICYCNANKYVLRQKYDDARPELISNDKRLLSHVKTPMEIALITICDNWLFE